MELSRWYHHRFPVLLSAAPDGAGEPPPGSHGTKRLPPLNRHSCPFPRPIRGRANYRDAPGVVRRANLQQPSGLPNHPARQRCAIPQPRMKSWVSVPRISSDL